MKTRSQRTGSNGPALLASEATGSKDHTMTLRHVFSWKFLFYDALLPLLRRLGPSRCDAVLAGLGRLASAWPPTKAAQIAAMETARDALGADWDVRAARKALAANVARFVARDYPLDGLTRDEVFSRFDIQGFEHLESTLAQGRGAILLGCHLGAYLAGVHWLYRTGAPVRLLVQRPGHVSGFLNEQIHRADTPHPQSGFFLRRRMPAGEGAERLVRARMALRDGLAVYLSGDIPWPSCHARPGRFLGQSRPFQSVWAELSSITAAPVVPIFCLHQPGGRYALRFDPPFHPNPATAVPQYLERLESLIAAHPSEAVAHLTWPCYLEAGDALPIPPPARPSFLAPAPLVAEG
ncbi:MAG: Lauroyl/myristoyl acyltransferase [Planctomycetota bacterium]|nr:Lauroyl/myristoyl acyltransferase [Planctomycetota bacterium]